MDILLVILAFATAYGLRFHFQPLLAFFPIPGGKPLTWQHYQQLLTSVVPLWTIIFLYAAKLYSDPFLPLGDKAVRVLNGCVQGSLATLAISFLSHRFADSRLMALLLFPISFVYVFIGHALLQYLHQFGLELLGTKPRLLIVGEGHAATLLKGRLEQSNHRTLFMELFATKGQILSFVLQNSVSEVILTQTPMGRKELLELAEELESLGIEVRIVPNLLELRMGELQIDKNLGLPMLHLRHTSLSGTNFLLKRFFDLVFGTTVLLVGFLPFCLIALAIKLETPGPVLFRQRRAGFRGRLFNLYKFRSMMANAEGRRDQLDHLNERPGAVFKLRNDPRITRMGGWLRRLSLDELPQLLNVLKGEMSVAGPRPPLPSEVKQYGATAMRRLNVLPGITGLWQVSGRADVSFDQMVALDLYYIEHWSLGMDVKIIFKTIPAMISGRGAY